MADGTKPPPWFLPVVGAVVAVAVVLFVIRSGDDGSEPAGASSPTGSVTSPASPTTQPPQTTQPPATTAPPTTAETTTPPPTTGGGGVALGASCSWDVEGYGIDYPTGWFTPEDPLWVCQLFDPVPFDVPAQTEPPLVAVTIWVDHHRMARTFNGLTDPQFYRTDHVSSDTFGDAQRPGTIVETEQVEALLYPAGTRTYSILVDLGDRTIVVSTNDLAPTDYEANKQIAFAMAKSLRLGG
jgi:hypothetical protein